MNRLLSFTWLGDKPMSESQEAAVALATRMNPDMEVRVWKLSDFGGLDIPFFWQAIERRAWAFASDVARLHILKHHGGIYSDIDVSFHKPASHLVKDGTFTIGWESPFALGPHFIGSDAGHPFLASALATYEKRTFALDSVYCDCTPAPAILTWLAQRRYRLTLNGRPQKLGTAGDRIEIIGQEVTTLDLGDGANVCEHEYAGSWLDGAAGDYKQTLLRMRKAPSLKKRVATLVANSQPSLLRWRTFNLLNGPSAYPGGFTKTYAINRWDRYQRRLQYAMLPDAVSPLLVRSHHHIRPMPARTPLGPIITVSATRGQSVDVVVPIYGVAKFLNRCLGSLAEQDHRLTRVIMIDDGSIDGSAEIAKAYATEYSHFVYHRQANTGLGGARNKGLELAHSELISFVDADDYVEPDFVSSLVAAIGTDRDLSVCGMDEVAGDGRYFRSKEIGHIAWLDEDPIVSILNSPNECYAMNKMFRLQKFRDTGARFGKGIYEDFAIIPALIANCMSAGFVPTPKYHYVQHSNSIIKQMIGNRAVGHNVIRAYDELANFKHLFLGDRWDRYSEGNAVSHLVLFRLWEMNQISDMAVRREVIETHASALKERLPQWSKSQRVHDWVRWSSSPLNRFAKSVLIRAFETGDPSLYLLLSTLRRAVV